MLLLIVHGLAGDLGTRYAGADPPHRGSGTIAECRSFDCHGPISGVRTRSGGRRRLMLLFGPITGIFINALDLPPMFIWLIKALRFTG